MRPNETVLLPLKDGYTIEQRKTIIESKEQASVTFAISIQYNTNGDDKVPVYIHVCSPDKGLPRDFRYTLELYSMQTRETRFVDYTSLGNRSSRKICVLVDPSQIWNLKITKPKTSFWSRLIGKPKLWLYVAPHRSSREVDVTYT